MKVCSICQRGITANWWCPLHPFAPQESWPSGTPIMEHTAMRLRKTLAVMTSSLSPSQAGQVEIHFWKGVTALKHEIESYHERL